MDTNTPTQRAALLRTRQIIGQEVIDPAGTRLGKVSDLLLDRRRGEVTFLDVDLGVFQKRVLMPVSAVDWSADHEAFNSRWAADQVEGLPGFDPNQPLTDELLDEMERAYPHYYGTAPPPRLHNDRELPTILPLRDAKDFKISKGEPDVRGWNVFGADGERVGTVKELLVDSTAMKIRYLDVDLADDLFLLKEDRHVLVPLESVELKDRGRDVWVHGATAREIARLPAYGGGALDPTTEDRVRETFNEPQRGEPHA